ncbi:MAG: hypothetical protein AAGF04_01635 [Chlamydiota bacterium]
MISSLNTLLHQITPFDFASSSLSYQRTIDSVVFSALASFCVSAAFVHPLLPSLGCAVGAAIVVSVHHMALAFFNRIFINTRVGNAFLSAWVSFLVTGSIANQDPTYRAMFQMGTLGWQGTLAIICCQLFVRSIQLFASSNNYSISVENLIGDVGERLCVCMA